MSELSKDTDIIDARSIGTFFGVELYQPLVRQEFDAVVIKFDISKKTEFLSQLVDWSRIYAAEKRHFGYPATMVQRRDTYRESARGMDHALKALEEMDSKLLDEMRLIDLDRLDDPSARDLEFLITKGLAGESEQYPGIHEIDMAPVLASLRILLEQSSKHAEFYSKLKDAGKNTASSKYRYRNNLIGYIIKFWTEVLERTASTKFDTYIDENREYSPESLASQFACEVAVLVDRELTASNVERAMPRTGKRRATKS